MSAVPALLVDDKAAWLAARQKVITGTRISAILGLNPYESAHDVYLTMVGLKEEREANEAMQTGSDLEPYIAAVYAKRFKVELTRADFTLHPDHSELGCTPDYFIGVDTVLEIKWVGQHAAQNFGDAETDQIPNHYLCQVQWSCYVTGRKKWVLYVLGPWGFRRYLGKFDEEMGRRMSFHALKFYGEYIKSENPPPLTGAQADTNWVNGAYPADDGSIVQATDEIDDEAADLGNKLQVLDQLETEVEGIKNRLKDFMGDAQILRTECAGNFTWKNSKGRATCDKDAVIAVLAERLHLPADDLANLLIAHTSEKPGPRVFRTPFKGQKA